LFVVMISKSAPPCEVSIGEIQKTYVKYKKTYVNTASDLIDFSILVNKVVISREVSMS